MKAFRLIAGFIQRVDRAARPGNEILSRAQIRRIGLRLTTELYERMGSSNVGRDKWLQGAREIVEGAVDRLFSRQLPKGFDGELYALRLAVEVLKEYQNLTPVSPPLECWCNALESCHDLRLISSILDEICDANSDVGDRFYVRVEIVKDLVAVPACCKPQRSPGAGLTAFG